jgi:hypothetical protein
MKTITSVSGGQTSAYIAANYSSDYLVFSLVRIEDKQCKFKDEKIRKIVEDKIQAPFIATSEDDMIIYTMLDLEQYLGKKINWVTGITFDDVIKYKSGWLPNKLHRYCTTYLKIEPIFNFWKMYINDPVYMQIGFRVNETNRANNMLKKCDENGYLKFKTITGKTKSNKNKWSEIIWQKPVFPLINDAINKNQIINFWKNKPVKFAEYNNCVGCFHRNPVFLKLMFEKHTEKMNWFASQEGGKNGYWKSENGNIYPYERIRKMLPQMTLDYTDFSSCDAGYCGM